MKIKYEGQQMAVQSFPGPITVVMKCIYKPEWATWEKMLIVPIGQTMQVSDTFWNLYAYDTEEQARAANPEFPEDVYEIHQMG